MRILPFFLPVTLVILVGLIWSERRVEANVKSGVEANASIESTAAMSSIDDSEGSEGKLRLVILSDTHQFYSGPIPPGDVLIHCGDSEFSGSEFNSWARKHDHHFKLAVSGNMDDELKEDGPHLQNVTYLQDESVTLSGLKFYGSPWTPKFVGVFQLNGDREASDIWTKMPDDVDVLITHGPPAGILDQTSRGMRVGDRMLLNRVQAVKPRVHCFGHIHESYGTEEREHTLYCNAAVFNGHAPIVVDVPLDRAKPAVLVRGA